MNAKVNIDIGVTSKKRYDDEPFRPTRTWTAPYNYVTDLDNYSAQTTGIANTVYTYVQGQRIAGCEVFTHIGIRVDNPTHPTPAAGVVPLAKRHWDIAISDDEFTDATVFQQTLNTMIADLRASAKY